MNIYTKIALGMLAVPAIIVLFFSLVTLVYLSYEAIIGNKVAMIVLYIFIAFAFAIAGKANASSSQSHIYIQGTVKPIVTYTITKQSDKVYNITVLSNNPNGFQLTVTTDTETKILSTSSQTETKTFNYTLNFTSAPSYVNIVLSGD